MWRIALILCICAISMGDETSQSDILQSPAGKEALRRYEVAYVAARQTFYHSMIDADAKKIADLDRAMKIAMNAANLDEANRLKAAGDAAADTLKEHKLALDDITSSQEIAQPEAAQTFAIFAHERWKTTVMVKKGQRYRVTAKGQWSGGPDANKNKIICGPEGILMPDGDHQGEWVWYLEGRVNRKYPFVIGAHNEFVAQEDGPLEMQMMDWWIYDNDGSVEAQVQHIPVAGP
jgi:hypothetical protein